jgi:hypothetical protein
MYGGLNHRRIDAAVARRGRRHGRGLHVTGRPQRNAFILRYCQISRGVEDVVADMKGDLSPNDQAALAAILQQISNQLLMDVQRADPAPCFSPSRRGRAASTLGTTSRSRSRSQRRSCRKRRRCSP